MTALDQTSKLKTFSLYIRSVSAHEDKLQVLLYSFFGFSCHGDVSRRRDKLILPSLKSTRVYVIDTGTNERAPTIFKVGHNLSFNIEIIN